MNVRSIDAVFCASQHHLTGLFVAKGVRAVSRLVRQLGSSLWDVDFAIDHLKVWQAPIIEERRPRCIPVFAPHSKQRDTMINFSAPPQPSTAFAAAPCLQASEEPGVATRRSPKLPCDHACGVPDCILVDPSVPQIDMPPEAINRLPAHTAKAGPPARMRVPERARVASGMWLATHSCGCRRAASSSRSALRCAEGGVLAAHAADNEPLAANVISTLSYQLANTDNPRQAALLARTAYAGARHSATATTKALLLERVAWADAKSGDLVSCERALGQVEENFNHAEPEDDPELGLLAQ